MKSNVVVSSVLLNFRWARIAALLGLIAFACATPARAQSEILDQLLEKLKDKGVLSEDEYQALKHARDEERLEQRSERRRQAVKAAQETEKEEKPKTATKFDVNPGIKSMQLYGDARLRFESRDAYSPSPAGLGVTGTNDVSRERWRYAVRIGLRGDLTDDWFYGVRAYDKDGYKSPVAFVKAAQK